MAKANFVKAAQKDIYTYGKNVQYLSKKGKREGQTKSKHDRTVPKDENDPIFIAKGESYYWWQFKNGGKHFSKERPKSSQLTQSNYLSQLYSIQESMETIEANDAEELNAVRDDLVSQLESLKEETESSLENMPESLQSSPTGELLQERIDALDSAISELEEIDLDYEEPDDDDIKEEFSDEPDITEEGINERKEEKLQEWLDEKRDEIMSISFE